MLLKNNLLSYIVTFSWQPRNIKCLCTWEMNHDFESRIKPYEEIKHQNNKGIASFLVYQIKVENSFFYLVYILLFGLLNIDVSLTLNQSETN